MPEAPTPTQSEMFLQARRFYVGQVLADLSGIQAAVMTTAHELADMPAERNVAQMRWDVVQELMQKLKAWPEEIKTVIELRLGNGSAASTLSAPPTNLGLDSASLQLVDDETVQRNILESRMALAVLDRTTWEFADLRARLSNLSGQQDLDDTDLFRPQVLGRCVLKAWLQVGLSLEAWKVLESTLHKQWGERAESAFKATNEWLVERGVVQEVNLRSFIRRTESRPTTTEAGADTGGNDAESTASPSGVGPAISGYGHAPEPRRQGFAPVLRPNQVSGNAAQGVATGMPGAPGGRMARAALGAFITRVLPSSLTAPGGTEAVPEAGKPPEGESVGVAQAPDGGSPNGRTWITLRPGQVMSPGGVGAARGDEETRMMTQPGGMDPQVHAQVVLQRFSDLVEQHLPGFRETVSPAIAVARAPSARLSAAMEQAQQRLQVQVVAVAPGAPGAPSATPVAAESAVATPPTPAQLVEDLKESQKALKKAASTPGERATIELVALLFQSILGEEQIPPSLRVWFARLQMPTLRVALAEPDFFSTVDHPARKLIDRMGGCVMGFEGAADVIGTPLEAEIKRVVQVVEAFPDTGRRVFQAVVVEFERFLERYYREQHVGARNAVSLAQKIEQRETLAIQYTIELRKLLNDVPVHERVRDFLFHVWADVLATMAVRHGAQSEPVKVASDGATELVWAASAKFSQLERREVVERLPTLLGLLRHGMSAAGLDAKRQDEAVNALVPPLQAAFSAASNQVIPDDQLKRLKEQLEAIEEVLPEGDLDLDDSWVLDEAAHHYEGLEIVAEGGSMPEPNMLEWAERVEVGAAFILEYRGRRETVRLVWQGMHRQLSLFLTPQGRCVLFQKMRLAAFLQAGLMVPAQEESLTTAATRKAYSQVARDPAALAE